MSSWIQDLRWAARQLRRSPGFTAVAILTLALGIGANTAVFSLVNSIFLKPLAVADPTRLISISQALASQAVQLGYPIAYADYLYYRDHTPSVADLAAHYATSPMHMGPAGRTDESASIQGAVVTWNYFRVLGLGPVTGRFFLEEEDQVRDRNPVAVIGHDLWRTQFDGNPQIAGTSIVLNGETFSIVGVAPAGFHGATRGLGNTAVWIPSAMFRVGYRGCDAFERSCRVVELLGRLRDGRSVADAQAEMDVAAGQLESTYPDTNKGRGILVMTLRGIRLQEQVGFSSTATLLVATTGLVLLTACANLSGLLLARGVRRRREIAVRHALGAGRFRLVRQLFLESVLLAVLGSGAGLLVAWWTKGLLEAFYGNVDLALDGLVLGVTSVLAVLTALLFGMFPAYQASRPDVVPVLKFTGTDGVATSRLRDAIIVVQVALAVVLVVGAALLVQSVGHVSRGPFEVDHLVLVRLRPSLVAYDAARARAFQRDVIERLETLPGVVSASPAAYPPLPRWGGPGAVWLPGQAPASPDAALQAAQNWVGPLFFRTLGVSLIEGREFDTRDTPAAPPAIIVGEALARRLWPNSRATGNALFVDGREYVVVGVARDAQFLAITEQPRPFIYRNYWQWRPDSAISLDSHTIVRVSADAGAILPTIRRAIAAVDANVPGNEPWALADRVAITFRTVQGASTLLVWLAGIALFLTTIGLYAVLAFTVSQRTREIAVRMALGATQGRVARAVIGQGAGLAGLGAILGIAGALGGAQYLASLMYGVQPYDPVTMVAVTGLLMAVALAASYVPARRASRVEPIVALRSE